MLARIYKPARSAMTSGLARTKNWVLEFEPARPRKIDPLMGWIGSDDTQPQVRMTFPSMEAAVAYAQEHKIPFVLSRPHPRKPNIRKAGYGENFAPNRRQAWTH